MQRSLPSCAGRGGLASTASTPVAVLAPRQRQQRESSQQRLRHRRRRRFVLAVAARPADGGDNFSRRFRLFLGSNDDAEDDEDAENSTNRSSAYEDYDRMRSTAVASGWEDFDDDDDDSTSTSPFASSSSSSSPVSPPPSSSPLRPPPRPPPPRPPRTGWEPPRGSAAPPSPAKRRDTPRGPRDEFVRPIIDPFGVGLRLGPDPAGAEDDLDEELEANRSESARAGAFLATAFLTCSAVGFVSGHVVAAPLVAARAESDPDFLAPTPKQRAEGGRAIQEREAMLRLEAAVGKLAPEVATEDGLLLDARAEATSLAKEFRERNERALVDLAQDSAAALAGFFFVALPSRGRAAFFGAFGRIFSGLSDTAKAFLIIASTDIFLGYHSEEGWTAAIHLLTSHYNAEPDERGVALFIATVPVVADAFFKLWIFKGLNRANPSAAVTLKQMGKD